MPATTKVSEDWPRTIRNAQRDTTRLIRGKVYERVRYGREGRGRAADTRTSGDCGVTRGQYHVPGSDLERCPACRGQMITCRCADG